MLENDRPVLDVIKFSDDLKDVLNVVLGGFNVLKSSTSGGQAQTGEEAYGVVTEGLERLDDLEPLPDTIGAFISVSLIKEILVDNPQIAGLSEEEQARFVIDQACKQLRELVEAEPDADRSDALRAAQRLLECPGAVEAPGAEDPEEEEPTLEVIPEEEEPTVEVPEEDVAPAREMVYEGTYSHAGDSSGEIEFYVYDSGHVTLRYRKTTDASNDAFQPSAFWNTVHGTHESGAFTLRVSGNEWATGTFNEESVSGSAAWGLEFSGSRVR
jgi:Arc/MetJ-type ribon-helix-helix transcriptional regulator